MIDKASRLIVQVLEGAEYAELCKGYVEQRMSATTWDKLVLDEEQRFQLETTLADEFTSRVMTKIMTNQ